MNCPRCAVAAISAESGICEVCGYRLDSPVAVDRADDALMELVTRQLTHEFDIVDIAGRREGAIVFRALEKSGGRSVILKVVKRRQDDPEAEVRFRATMDTFSRLDHPHIVPVLRFGATDSLLWHATLDTGSVSLRAMLQKDSRLDARTSRRIATQVVSALEYLHRHGLVHGAVRAENVLIDPQGWAWLTDPAFERARPAERPSWLAPEDMTRAERLPTSDQFAIAALVFECVAGEPPREPGEQVARFRPEVTRTMSDAIARALDPQPFRRFATCADFLWALEDTGTAIRQGRPSGRLSQDVLLIPDWTPPEAHDPPKHHLVRWAIFGAVIIALVVAIPHVVRRFESAREPTMTTANSQTLAPPTTFSSTPSAPARASEPVATEPPPVTTAPESRAPQTRAPASRPRTPTAPSSIPRAQPVAPEPEAPVVPARLTINSSPWGQVFVDDVLIGNTPRMNIELAPGSHVVRVVRAGFAPFSRTVRVEPGDTLRITDIVLTPGTP